MAQGMLPVERKALGAFYTPRDAAHYMASWAIRSNLDHILEPSVGDGEFVAAATDVAAVRGWRRPRFVAAELNPRAAADVVQHELLSEHEIFVGNFLKLPIRPVQAALGNPPYVRLRALPEDQAKVAADAVLADIGEPMLSSGSVWMPFVSRTAMFLSPGGRMALVLPWDMTYVKYARPLWRFLARTFGSLRVVRVRERLFPDIGQDVLLLFADAKGRETDSVKFEAHSNLGDLVKGVPESTATVPIDRIVQGGRPFQEALLPRSVLEVIANMRPSTTVTRDVVQFNIGYVTGDKDYFHPKSSQNLPSDSLRPAITNARRIRGGGLYTSNLDRTAVASLWSPGDALTTAEKAYEELGRRLGVDRAYKCRVRQPWYRVPGVKVPDVILSVFSSLPVMMLNDGGYVATNSLLCGYLLRGDRESFAASWYTSYTLLQAELEIHSLGGGVLVLVPGEAGSVRIPTPGTVPPSGLSEMDARLTSGSLRAAYESGDRALESKFGLEAVELLRHGVDVLTAWRVAR